MDRDDMNQTIQRSQEVADELARDDALHADFGWALGVVFRAYRKSANAVIAGMPGGPRGYQVLTAAARPAPMSQAAIAQDTGLDRTVMTYLVDDLESAGLLQRQQDPSDRRARLLVVTSDGEARLREFGHRLAMVEQHVLQGLPTADQLSLRCLLQRLARQVDAIEPGDDRCKVMTDIDANEQR
jgi:DNA-binding MarR family transcriptional regulator